LLQAEMSRSTAREAERKLKEAKKQNATCSCRKFLTSTKKNVLVDNTKEKHKHDLSLH
jgi:hypothetical protein